MHNWACSWATEVGDRLFVAARVPLEMQGTRRTARDGEHGELVEILRTSSVARSASWAAWCQTRSGAILTGHIAAGSRAGRSGVAYMGWKVGVFPQEQQRAWGEWSAGDGLVVAAGLAEWKEVG